MDRRIELPMRYSGQYGTLSDDQVSPQIDLFSTRVRDKLPGRPNGADLVFVGHGDDGRLYYCKGDKSGRPVRFIEAVSTRLARHLGIATSNFCILEDDSLSESFFGSQYHISTAQDHQRTQILITPSKSELGQPLKWLGPYLSALYAFDMFMKNWDRRIENFVLHAETTGRRLCAIDFAASCLQSLGDCEFPVAANPTVRVGRLLWETHGFHHESAFEMLKRIEAVPVSTLSGFMMNLPEDWAGNDMKAKICDDWAGSQIRSRLETLRAGIANESLL